MVEGPKGIVRQRERHLETVCEVTYLRAGQKVVVWEDFGADGAKPMWLTKGDIGTVMSVDGDGDALINFPGKDSGGKSLSTIVKKRKWSMLRAELAGKPKSSRPTSEAPPPKRRTGSTAEAAPDKGEKTSDKNAGAKTAVEAPLTEEERERQAVAMAWLRKDPKKGVVRFTFTDPGPLGLRFSKDVPPWILAVNNNTQAARKAPRVPVAGIVTAINGFEITEKGCQEVMEGLKKRPVILDIDWPIDQELPVVNRA